MDLSNLTFAGLVVIGVVNVITMFYPKLDSKQKFAIALIVAFAVSFVPVNLASDLAQRIKDAVAIALASSGAYKLFQII